MTLISKIIEKSRNKLGNRKPINAEKINFTRKNIFYFQYCITIKKNSHLHIYESDDSIYH